MAKRFRVRRIGVTWQDKVIEAESATEAKSLAECIDGDLTEYQSNFHEDQVEVEVVDDDEPITEISHNDEAWLRMYHEQQYRLAQGGA